MIVIGDEILNGRTVDMNASWLTKFLFKSGLELSSIRFVRDDMEEIHQSIREAFSERESDIVITSGGIGPTIDDKTKNALATFFGKIIIERKDVAEIVTENYQRFGRTWKPDVNGNTQVLYHFFPEDFIAISNPKGLAPGIGYYDDQTKKLILSGPGVPSEFFEMVDQQFIPQIQKYFPDGFKTNYQTVIRTQGVPEEKIFFELCPSLWCDLEKFGKVSSLPHTLGIDIIVSYHEKEHEGKKTHEKNQKLIREIIEATPLKTHVWQWGNSAINQLVLKTAIEKNKTFAFAESCTGGLISSKITDLPGASQAFWGSIISYDNSVKINLLNVKQDSLNNFGAVSLEVAREMAEGVRLKLNVDYGISITGIAGPHGGTTDKPVGTVVIGFSSALKNESKLFCFSGDRIRLKERFSDKALLCLLELLNEN